jgi:hypothetical protein
MDDRSSRRPRRSLSFSNVVAVIALFVALGGTSLGAPVREAAGSLASRVTKALRTSKHSDATAKKALRTARRAQAKADAVAGTPGPQGPAGRDGAAGKPGAAGAALGYAAVEYCASGNCPDQNTVDWFAPDDDALGVDNQANFKHPAAGTFCFHTLPFHLHNVVANLGPSSGGAGTNLFIVQTQAGTADAPVPVGCSPGGAADQNAVVYVRNLSGNLVDPDLSQRLLALFN